MIWLGLGLGLLVGTLWWALMNHLEAQTFKEVTFTGRCACGCFEVKVGSSAVWRFEGSPAFSGDRDSSVLIHAAVCGGKEGCATECWGEEQTVG